MLKVWVLWILFSTPWNFGPIPITEGWWGAVVTQSEEECTGIVTMLHEGRDVLETPPMICLPATAVPPDTSLPEKEGDDV